VYLQQYGNTYAEAGDIKRMKEYKHIFFDLDRTLWDFDANSKEAILELLEEFNLLEAIGSAEKFVDVYHYFNELYWKSYRQGKIMKSVLRIERFVQTLLEFGIHDRELAKDLNNMYLQVCPTKTNLLPGAHDLLNYLVSKYYLHIITNGFTATQLAKLQHSGIRPYFRKIFTSETAGSNKPRRHIFEVAVKSSNARKTESLMVGDDYEIDILGAMWFGIDQAYFNPSRLPIGKYPPTMEVYSLDMLKSIL
jgi:putative hydrolase of the HAD superfamily